MPKLELHASSIKDFQACPRMYHFAWVEQIEPKTQSFNLFFGNAIHHALAKLYASGADPIVTFDAYVVEKATASGPLTFEQETDIDKVRKLGASLLSHYLEWQITEPQWKVLSDVNGKPLVERKFVVPIINPETGRPTRGVHAGTMDLLVQDEYGGVWIVDHKTADRFHRPGVLPLDPQVGSYYLAAKYLFPDVRLAGVIYNTLRKVDPARARTPVFRRDAIRLNDVQVERLQERMYRTYRRISSERLFEPTPDVYGACDWRCRYSSLCLAMEDGTDVGMLKESLYQKKESDESADSDDAA